ncbi:MAG TPA: hypothetical protein VFM49_04585, partial [Chloroflexia bacterium]|nr:hypothetical protein [Chloroflexia bacterium]
MRVWKRAARALIIGLVALLLLGGGILLRGIALPAPTGPYAVGRATFHWIDATRPEVLAPAGATGGKREVIANLWYPATPAPSRPTAPYFAGLDALAD